jgi:hypothetical protein
MPQSNPEAALRLKVWLSLSLPTRCSNRADGSLEPSPRCPTPFGARCWGNSYEPEGGHRFLRRPMLMSGGMHGAIRPAVSFFVTNQAAQNICPS